MTTVKRPRTSLVLLAATLALAALCTAPAGAEPRAADPLKEVLFVGNNWDGTADVVRSTGTFAKVGHINVIPDKVQRLTEIYLNPVRLAIYLAIQQGPGEGHDQYVDDMYTTPDGKSVVVSRPSFGDVVSLDLATGKVNWRYGVAGYRSDHMALSPDGRRLVVSASLANAAFVIDIQTGRQLGSFPTGDKPHENVFTEDGKYLWNMSIGEVQTNLDAPLWDWTKGDRHITVVDGATYRPIRTIDMRARLNAFGRSDLSNAVRPVAFSPDWSKLYFQVSFFNGFVEYSVATDTITRVKTLPENPATDPDRTTWPNDSRDHGLSMSPDGAKLCVAGTVDDYATVVDRTTLQEGPLIPASKPYWATLSGDGKSCIISESGANQITAIDFATGQKILSVPVGYHPQRVRLGHVAADWTGPATG
ncbi:YncE family protein [Streptomyces sp. SID13666]|uniref:YncE family protein n=1 Tax=unclassified Streptomyces TaxID=2593676 RepID=UPI0013BF59BE|nr:MULTISPECIES: YncE family protein [unclassified Streptomyces]NEA52867.1 YncE family protein [Streptomyces sp. SID13666]NEA69806.1 YncE family protein [Streptomyces sp. SID13588]